MKKFILTTILMCLPLSLMAKNVCVVKKAYANETIRDLQMDKKRILNVTLDQATDGYCVITWEYI
jgi:hypothetical protein